MKKNVFRKASRFLTLAIIFCMMLGAVLPLASLTASADAGSSSATVTTPGTSENQRYFKEDTSYDMSEKIDAPMTIEFELTGCTHIAGAVNGGVIIGNYSEDATSYINVEAVDYGKLVVRGMHDGTAWTATFYQSEADIRVGGVNHYTITIGTGWAGVTLYVNGVSKATRYPASITLPKASEFTNPFRIGGDYRSGNTNYFKGLINSVALFSDIRTNSEINADKARAKTWSSSTQGLVAAYDITKMGEAALRDYSGNGNKLVYNNQSGIQVENFGKYEIEGLPGTSLETFEAWVYMPKYYSGVIGGTILGNYRSYNGARLFYEIYKDGTPRFSYTNASGKNVYHRFTDVDLRTGTWQHLAIVHDLASGEARCYVNGELKQTIADGTVAAYNENILNQNFLIGRDTALRYAEGDGQYWDDRKDQYFKGFIKEIRVYSDVRSSDEIAADYTGSLDLTDESLLACYQLTPESAYTNIADLSGNGYLAEYKQLLWEREYVEPVGDYAYSFALVGDTQTVTEQNPELLKNIYQWIIDNKTAMNIQYVIGLGDITEYGVDVGHTNYSEERANKQWQDAKAAITMMDGILPYTLIRGDGHDGIELFNEYFASHEGYTKNITGYMEEGRIDNVYHTFRVGEVDYMVLCLDHGTKDEVIAWANEVVSAHPNHRVIVTTHHYMQSDGTLSESGETGNATAYDPNNNAADVLWNEFLKKHPNIRMVMCGHSDSEEVLVTKQIGEHGNEVTQILINPQGMDAEYYHGSKGMVAMLHFSEDGQDVQVEYYSTIKGTYRPTTTSFTVDVSDKTHTYESVVTAPTCTAEGYTTNTCTACGDSYVDGATAALGHSYDSVVTAPTCTEAGYTTNTCTVCGDSYVDGATEALGHTETTIEGKDATCTENGITDGKKCTVCGVTTVPQTVIAAKGHTDAEPKDYFCDVCGADLCTEHVEEIVAGKAPTCTEEGLSDGLKCSVCGDIILAQSELPALGHSYEAVVTAPTCTEAGYTTNTCTACGEGYLDNETEALGHTKGEAVVENEVKPDCVNNGSHDSVVYCTACSEELSRETVTVDAIGHSWMDATTEAPKTCERCGETEGDKLPAPEVEPDEPTDEPTVEKDHSQCKADGIIEMIVNFIANFLRELLGLPKQCICGDEL